MARTSEGLDPRRKRLLWRSWHRGMQEMDLLLGRFADAHLETLDEGDLDVYETLIEVPDRDLFAWLAAREPAPVEYDTPVFRRIRAFHTEGEHTS